MRVAADWQHDQIALVTRYGLHAADRPLVAPTAWALNVWRRARLELGEAAIYTDGRCAGVIGLVAEWRGALPVVRVTAEPGAPSAGVVGLHDGPAAVDQLRMLTANAPGLVAVDLSGRGDILSTLLESLPRWGRLVLAARSSEAFTTEFYTDVHRKGVEICAAADPESLFTGSERWGEDLRNACRLLAEPKRAAQLRECYGRER